MTLEEKLKEIRERAEKATPGPWVKRITTWGGFEHPDVYGVRDVDNNNVTNSHHNLSFIAASRTDVPQLVAALEKAVDALKFYAEGWHYRLSDGVKKLSDGGIEITGDLEIENGDFGFKTLKEIESIMGVEKK